MERKNKEELARFLKALYIITFIALLGVAISLPTGPTSIQSILNETKSSISGTMFNISGGYISKMNITASVQNPHWKAFVGWVNGQFTLEDSTGSKIYDWSLSSISGEVYATRHSGSISWENIRCANITDMEAENAYLSHTNPEDNITATFSRVSTHNPFVVAGKTINANSCPVLYTYVNNQSQTTSFQEVILSDNSVNIYTTIIENKVAGYDGNLYDFQMLVPENGSALWKSSIPYYIYVELS